MEVPCWTSERYLLSISSEVPIHPCIKITRGDKRSLDIDQEELGTISFSEVENHRSERKHNTMLLIDQLELLTKQNIKPQMEEERKPLAAFKTSITTKQLPLLSVMEATFECVENNNDFCHLSRTSNYQGSIMSRSLDFV